MAIYEDGSSYEGPVWSFTTTPNNPPTITSLAADFSSVLSGGSATITCSASDPDGDTLTYTWTKTEGTISGSGPQVTWTAPNTSGTYTITCTVSDGKGGTAFRSVKVSVTTIILPKTGQTTSYDTNTLKRDDGVLQRGVAWPSPRFTDHGNGTVTDNLTGLMWTKNANLPAGARTWQQALDYVAAMNAGTYTNFGYTDWRLPNINELESLIHMRQSGPGAWLNNQGFTNVVSSYYWSSSTYANNTNVAWTVGMGGGYVYIGFKSGIYYVWPVRAGKGGTVELPKTGQTTSHAPGDDGDLERGVAWPSPRFTDHGNGTVTDNLTGLMWTKNANLPGGAMNVDLPVGARTWQQALDYVAAMNAGTYTNFGYTDWRLPNHKELRSLIDYSRFNLVLPSNHPFTNVVSHNYWSSSTYTGNTDNAWAVNVGSGSICALSKSDNYHVWPVRAGQ